MAVLSYKCPNCGGGMIFNPESQNYSCEFCLSDFSQAELEALDPASAKEDTPHEQAYSQAQDLGNALIYTCPSCGAEIATDETTAATFCYYCHNPVVLAGKLNGDQMPAQVVPFKFTKEEAKERFISWIGKKKYVPADFFSKKQIEKLSGIYFPYWIYDCTVQGGLSGSSHKLRIWRAGDLEYTETSTYSIRRSGTVDLKEISRNALQKSQGKIMEGILPFDIAEAKDFHTGYLSGFQAEIKDMEKEAFADDIKEEADKYAKSLLTGSVTGHPNFILEKYQSHIQNGVWRYVLLPVWIMTYRSEGEMYYFAMNAQTGKICGRLPFDKKKLRGSCIKLMAIITAITTILGGLFLC